MGERLGTVERLSALGVDALSVDDALDAFDGLFADAVRGVERIAADRLHLELRAEPAVAGRAAELAAAETGCCSFFTFVLTVTGGSAGLDIVVPATHIAVLDALAERALSLCVLDRLPD